MTTCTLSIMSGTGLTTRQVHLGPVGPKKTLVVPLMFVYCLRRWPNNRPTVGHGGSPQC